MSVVMLAVKPMPISNAVGNLGKQRQDAETALYLIAFVVILPLALAAAPRLADAIAAGPNAAALSSLAAMLGLTLVVAVLLVRLSDAFHRGSESGALLLAVGIWSVAAGAALARATRPRPWRALLSTAGFAPLGWGIVAALAVGTLFAMIQLKSLSVLPLALGLVVIPTVVFLAERRRLPRLPGRWGVPVDVLILVLVLLAVPDLVIFRPEPHGAKLLELLVNSVIQFHHNFLLGPANQVLGGHAMLTDTASQYGVGSIYFLTGWFQLAPIGYGTYGFLDGVLTALTFAAGYGLLRLAGCSRPLAASTLALGVIVLVFNLIYPIGALPQQGPLRFGLPLALIVATVAAARWPSHSRVAQAAALAVLALSSIWALEAFAYTLATFAAMACFRAVLLPARGRRRWLARQAALTAAAVVCAHLVFAAATLAATGQLPDWGQYLAYLRAFLVGRLGDLTYDFSRWSPGLAIGAVYVASASALVLLIRSEPATVRRERVTLLAITGTTAYGIALFSYLVNRSSDGILPYIGLPVVLVTALWLSLLLRSRASLPRVVAPGALAFALSVALLVLAVAWSSIGTHFERSALGHVLPGGRSLSAALDRLWHFPPVDRRAPEGQRLLDRYMHGQRDSVVLVRPDLGTEILIRSGRANLLPLADPWEDSFVANQRIPGLRRAVAKLRPGQRLLLDAGGLATLAAAEAAGGSNALGRPRPGSTAAPLQTWTLEQIDRRFRLQPIYRDGQGFVVVQLARRP